MAHLHRLTLLLLLCVCGAAWAQTCTQYSVSGCSFSGPRADTKAAACAAWAAGRPGWIVTSQTESSCSGTYTPNGSSCNGNSYSVYTNQPCPDPVPLCPNAGSPAGSKRRDVPAALWTGSGAAWYACEGRTATRGCEVKVESDFAVRNGNFWNQIGPGTFTGVHCDIRTDGTGAQSAPVAQPFPTPANTTPVPSGQAAPEPCPRGQYTGQVNGVDVCIKPSAGDTVSSTTPGTTTTTDASGTSTEVKVSETATCTATRCTVTTTTTTTVRNSSGVQQSSNTTTGSADQDRAVYCSKNPAVAACSSTSGGGGAGGTDSTFSGSCNAQGGDYSCTGDAVSCAAAKAVNKLQCELSKQGTETAKYADIKGLTGNRTADLPGNATVQVGAGNFSTQHGLGAGQCIQDKTVTVAGRTISLPFSSICPHLGYLKTILLAVAYVAAIAIVFKGR